jgi:hypothetical protein
MVFWLADTMDVYVATNGTVRLMDFNPVGGSTAPLLFDWDELGYGESIAGCACCKILSIKLCFVAAWFYSTINRISIPAHQQGHRWPARQCMFAVRTALYWCAA